MRPDYDTEFMRPQDARIPGLFVKKVRAGVKSHQGNVSVKS